jgi:hypothetical protein
LAVLAVVVFVAGIALLGLVTPPDHVATSQADFDADPVAIWPLISQPERFPEWRADLESVDMLSEDRRQWRERGSFGDITYRLVVFEPEARFGAEIADTDQGYSGGWTWELLPRAGGTTVRVTESGRVDNPLFRAVARLTGLNATMDGALEALGAALGEDVEPVHVTPAAE